MNPVSKPEDDLRSLRALCDESVGREDRLAMLRSLENQAFSDPEHRVVFESIQFLLARGILSPSRLAVHLNNRGFPDVPVENYFPEAYRNDGPAGDPAKKSA
jgi:hypothetical protein